jgi:hypothetical protein
MQHYFDIINETHTNIEINLNQNIIYGIKKIVPISFKLLHEIRHVIVDSIQNVDTSIDYELNNYIYERRERCYENQLESQSDIDVSNNKLNIDVLKDEVYTVWDAMNMGKFKYDSDNEDYDGTDEFRIMDNMEYSYDYNNMDWITNNINTVLKNAIEGYEHMISIRDNKYLMLDEF